MTLISLISPEMLAWFTLTQRNFGRLVLAQRTSTRLMLTPLFLHGPDYL
jgi:hypothetical protein